MILSLLLSLLLIFFPASLVLYARGRRSGVEWDFLPLLSLLSLASICLLAPLLYAYPFGGIKYAFILALASLLSYFGAQFFFPVENHPRTGRVPFKPALWILLISAFLWLDVFLIYGASGWSFQHMNWFHEGPAYFRPPFTHDIERNVIITNSLIRRSETPYLPNAVYAYQLLWYHLCAVLVALSSDVAHYPQVSGVILATAFVFFYILMAFFSKIRPDLFKNKMFAMVLIALFFFHADLFNGFRSLFRAGVWTVDELSPYFFRYVSFHSMSVVSPQHCLFLLFLIGFLTPSLPGVSDRLKHSRIWEDFFCVLCFLCSPILSCLVLPWFGAYEWCTARAKLDVMLKWLLRLLLATVAHLFILRYSPSILWTRPTGERMFFPAGTSEWLGELGFTWVAMSGVLGALFVVLLLIDWRRRKISLGKEGVFLVFGAIFFNYIFAHSEIRRYFSMLALPLLCFWILRKLPSIEELHKNLKWRLSLSTLAILCVFSQGYFLKFYLMDRSTLGENIPWQDYFSMNEVVAQHFRGSRIIAASYQPLGLEKPFVMEVTTSFATPVETAVHTHLSKGQFEILKQMHAYNQTVPFARSLGYDKILWGPVEELAWGERVRDLFLDLNEPLARTGSVGLYQLKEPKILLGGQKGFNG